MTPEEAEGIELEIDHTYVNDVLTVRTELGGAKVTMVVDYGDPEATAAADILMQGLPRIMAAVLEHLSDTNPEEPA